MVIKTLTVIWFFVFVYYLFKILNKVYYQYKNMDFVVKSGEKLILKLDQEGIILETNDKFLEVTGYTQNDIVNKAGFLTSLVQQNENNTITLEKLIVFNGTKNNHIPIRLNDGSFLNVSWQVVHFKDFAGRIKYYLLVGEDISEISRIEEEFLSAKEELSNLYTELADTEEQIQRTYEYENDSQQKLIEYDRKHNFIVQALDIAVWEYDYGRQQPLFSTKFRELFNIPASYTFLMNKEEILSCIDIEDYYDFLETLIKCFTNGDSTFKVVLKVTPFNTNEIIWLETSGKGYYNEDNVLIYLAGSMLNITSNKQDEEKIRKIAFFDELTNIYNKRYMEDFVTSAIERGSLKEAALIFIDIDNFKNVNESLGYSFGDQILIEMAKRLTTYSEKNIVARLSGDEFCIFFHDMNSISEVEVFVAKLMNLLSETYSFYNIIYKVSASIGVALYPHNAHSFDSLFKCAEIAMYQSKQTGKNTYIYFDESMTVKIKERVELEEDFRAALGTFEDLKIYFQPQYDIKSGKLHGFEALARWISKKRGFVSPGVFIPLAEETRLIISLGKWILEESCKILREFQRYGHSELVVSVNLSIVQLMDDYFVNTVLDIVKKTGINPAGLELEITESILMESFESNVSKLNFLRAQGISISLDDFGTGYSSLTYLKVLPISTLKIDKMFVDNITHFDVDKNIALKIISLAHVLNLRTIAEGAEHAEQLECLKELDCDIVQGYYTGKPMPVENVYAILDKAMLEE